MKRWAVRLTVMLVIAWAGIAPLQARAQLPEWTLPEKFTLDALAVGLTAPTAFAFLPDGSALIAEQAGFVKHFANGKLSLEPALDLSGEVNALLERGLTGIAADVDFAQNNYVYLLYTYDAPGEAQDADGPRLGRLTRFTMRDGRLDPTSATVLLDGFESDVPYHAPGSVRAAQDGTLFVSFGDSSSPYEISDLSLRAQDLDQLQGKLIRITREGKAAPSNPFYDARQPDSVRSKVWAYGFRNPFRFGLQPRTNIPFVGNVGWNTTESIVRAARGANFGWPCYESAQQVEAFAANVVCAALSASSLVESDYDYAHAGNNAASIGGDFSIGDGFPDAMRGSYFFGDYSQRVIRRAVLNEAGRVSGVEDFAQGIGFPVDIQFGPDGALYFVDILGGQFKRIRYAATLNRPEARLSATTVEGRVPLTVTFDAGASVDRDGEALEYVWQFEAVSASLGSNAGKLTASTSPTAIHVYRRPGEYVARVTVVDGAGWSDMAEQRVVVRGITPSAQIITPADGETVAPGQQVTVSGRGFDANGALLPSSTLSWTVTWRDGAQQRVLASGQGDTASFIMPAAGPGQAPQRLEESASAVVTLEATDSTGDSGRARIRLSPQPRDGYIRTWWLIGGFAQRGLYDDVLPGGEAAFMVPADGAGAQLIQSPSRKINLANYIQPSENNVAYAFVWIDSPTDREALLGMNSDDGIAVWLNGQEVWRNKVARYVPDDTRDLDLPKVTLKQGLNPLLVKVDQAFGEWAFKLRVLNSNGSVMRDVTVKTQPVTP
jgi:glucose/arabinose dehydrogenase